MSKRSEILLHRLLELNTSLWHIRYKGFRANHLSYGLIALYKLGASSERIQQYYDNYVATTALEPARQPNPLVHITRDNWKNYWGDADNFPDLKLFFKREMERIAPKEGNADTFELRERRCKKLVSEYFPLLAEGIIGNAFHGMLQIGYGLEVMNETTVIEGLAFLASTFQSIGKYEDKDSVSSDMDAKDLIKVLNERVRSDSRVQKLINEEFNKDMGFTTRVRHLASHYTDLLKQFDLPLSESDNLEEFVKNLWLSIVKAYSSTGGNFFVLHCVTSARAFLQIYNQMDNKKDKIHALEYLCKGIIAAYICVNAPYLDKRKWTIDEAILNKLPSWDKIIQVALQVPSDREEKTHPIKIVFSCHQNDKDLVHDELHRLVAAKQMELILW